MLVDIYVKDRILFIHHMDTFDSLSVSSVNNPEDLKSFVQTCRACVNSLSKLGVNVDDIDEILPYYMLKKLPISIQNEWNRLLRKQKTIPTFKDLCTALDEQYHVLLTTQASQKSVKGNIKHESLKISTKIVSFVGKKSCSRLP